jgi:predicted TIM-barrel fold metal-dependent hydrolase
MPGFAGVRQILLRSRSRSPLTDGSADWLWETAERLDIPLMVWAPGQLDELFATLTRHPGLRVAVDHLGLGMDSSPVGLVDAVAAVSQFAALPRVAVKASALPAAASDGFPFLSVQGAVRELVATFGPERVFWGSDFTRLSCTYLEARSMMDHLALPAEPLASVMGGSFAAWLGSAESHQPPQKEEENRHVR